MGDHRSCRQCGWTAVRTGGGRCPHTNGGHAVTRPLPTLMVVPTGIGCEIGGFAGDALPSARCLAAASGCLITHPNVMNGAALYWRDPRIHYVEGYALDRFAAGDLQRERLDVLAHQSSSPRRPSVWCGERCSRRSTGHDKAPSYHPQPPRRFPSVQLDPTSFSFATFRYSI